MVEQSVCNCEQPTVSGCTPYYGWHDVGGNFEGLTTDEEKEADWQCRLQIARENTRKTMDITIRPKDKKEE